MLHVLPFSLNSCRMDLDGSDKSGEGFRSVMEKTSQNILSGLKPEEVFSCSDYLSNVCAEIRKIMRQRLEDNSESESNYIFRRHVHVACSNMLNMYNIHVQFVHVGTYV